MTAAIVANGEFPRMEYPRYLVESADIVLCCDAGSGLRGLLRMGLEPDVIIGDMDTATPAARRRFADRIVRFGEQEYNDLNKAFVWLLDNYPQVSDIQILGATGKSEAHALGNLSYLMFWEREHRLSERGVRVEMVSDYNTAFAVCDSCELHVGEGRKISFFSDDKELRIASTGLQWPTDGVSFDFWFRGTLNRAVSDVVSLRFNHPAPALVILD